MIIGIDIRSLINPHQTGVGQFTSGVLSALTKHTDHEYVLYYNGTKEVTLSDSVQEIGEVVLSRYPNKLVTILSPYLNIPKVDQIIEKKTEKNIDLLFSPNTQFIAHSSAVSHVMTIHDLSFVHFPEYYTYKQRVWHDLQRLKKQVNDAAAIIVPSESTKTDVINTFAVSADSIHVVCPGLENTAAQVDVKKIYDLPEQYFLFLGTIEPRKNLETLIEAYRIGNFYRQGIELIIAGAPGWKNKQVMQTIETTPGVRYIGYVDEAHKAALYKHTRTFIYPSLYEGFGFPVLEAMQQDTPVITSNRTSLPEVTKGAVRYVHPYRVSELVAVMKEKRSTQDYSDVVHEYTWERAAKQLDQLFQTYGKT